MSKSKYKAIRGGSWYDFARNERLAFRLRREPVTRRRYLGFRTISRNYLTKKRIKVTIEIKEVV